MSQNHSSATAIGAAWNGLLAVTLFVGGVVLLLRRTLGRALVVAGAVLALAATLLANGEVRAYFFAEVDGQPLVTSEFAAFLLFAMAVVAVVLSVIRPTSDWLEGKRRDDEEPRKQDRFRAGSRADRMRRGFRQGER